MIFNKNNKWFKNFYYEILILGLNSPESSVELNLPHPTSSKIEEKVFDESDHYLASQQVQSSEVNDGKRHVHFSQQLCAFSTDLLPKSHNSAGDTTRINNSTIANKSDDETTSVSSSVVCFISF